MENWQKVQTNLLNENSAERCPSCGAISAHSWEDANYCETESLGLNIPEKDRIYRLGTTTGFEELECGKCGNLWQLY